MLKKIFNIFFYILVVLILVIKLLNILHISFFGYQMFTVISGSMQPTINVGDIVLIKKQDNYFVNDIVTYKNDDNYITHRVVGINGFNMVTKGDYNNTLDDPIYVSDVVGKVVLILNTGCVVKYTSKPLFWIVLFIFGFIVTALIPSKK